jgi:hypothetical protein
MGIERVGMKKRANVAQSNQSEQPSPEVWAEIGLFVTAHPELSLAAVARQFRVSDAALRYRCRRFGWRTPAKAKNPGRSRGARKKPVPAAGESPKEIDPEAVTARVLIDAARRAVLEALRQGPPGELAVLAKTAAEVARITAQAEALSRPGDKEGSEVEALETMLRDQPEVLDLVEGFLERVIGGGGPNSIPDVHDSSGPGPMATVASPGRPVPGPAAGGGDP